MKSFLPNDIKDRNRRIIYDIFLREPQLAKVEINERTAMSFVTVSKIVDYFNQIGILSISGENREGNKGLGRRRVLYNFNPNSYLTVGIQIISRKISAVLMNLYNEIIETYSVSEDGSFYEENAKEIISRLVKLLSRSAEINEGNVIGIGIGVDGAIDEQRKTIRMKSSKSEEKDYYYQDILDYLEQQTGLPVILENDVNASAVAEFGSMKKRKENPNDLLFISLGDGIGAGLILDKKLQRGQNAGAGEMEYMCFDPEYVNNPSSVGWLESRINLDYLKEHFNFNEKLPDKMSPADKINSIDYIGKYLGLAISNTVSFMDMDSVILSGKTITAFPFEIADITQKYVEKYSGWDINITVSTYENLTAAGAAMLSLDNEIPKIIAGKEDNSDKNF